MAKTVIIACRLPHGLVIENPLNPAHTVTLNGINSSRIIGADHGVTEVDADLWELWKTTHADFPALKNNAIFEAKDAASAKAKAKEVKAEATGFEPLEQGALGVSTAKE